MSSQAAVQIEPAPEPAYELSILMPCLNEALTLPTCIDMARRFLERSGVRGEIVIADNGSTDGSQQLAERLGARVVPVDRKGYGSALMAGVAASRGRYVIMGDSDASYDFLNLEVFVEKLRQGYELVMGNRFLGGIRPGAMPFLHRYLGNPVLSGIGRLFFKAKVGDFQCGLRGFHREAILKLDLRTTGMEYSSEMVVKATLHQLKTAEVPTTLSPDGRNRPPHLRTWRDGWRYLRFLLLYSPRWLFLYPGVAMMAAGTGVALWLLPGPRSIGFARLDVHTLLYACLLVLIGFQSTVFAAFTKHFAMVEGLLPWDPAWYRAFTLIKLETGLVIGALLIAAGLYGSLYAVRVWSDAAYGALDYSRMMRLVLPSAFALVLGSQVVLSSFFMSVLGMRRR